MPALWNLCAECISDLNQEDQRLLIDSAKPAFPSMVTFTLASPVVFDSTNRGKRLRSTTMLLSDATFLLTRSFAAFEFTIQSISLLNGTEREENVPHWVLRSLTSWRTFYLTYVALPAVAARTNKFSRH
jgi:hypothetical protein